MSQLALYLLGTPRLELNGVPLTIDRRKVLALLTYLALTQHPHRRDHLAALFWPGYDHPSARANLRRTLSLLNQIITGNWLQTDRETIALIRLDDFWLDVDQFHQRLTACTTHSHAASEVCSDCLEPLTQAVTLYQDDLLTGFTLPDSPEFDDWQLFQTESLRRELAETLEKLVRGHSAQGEFEPAIAFARRWLALDPLQEAAYRHLMRLLTLTGERNAALSQYKTCRQILADELGVEPTTETTGVYEQIRAGELSGDAAAQTGKGEAFSDGFWPSPSVAPRHNLPDQLTPFIGRAEAVAEIIRLIRDEPTCCLLTLVGPGGIGKTRLALQAAAQAIEIFPDGVYFVSLAPLNTAGSVLPTTADALKFPLSSSNPKEQLLNYLSKRTMLLVLDNFEHLIPHGVTDLLSEMTIRAPQIKLLITSRERLNLREEWGVEVSGLRIPTGIETEETSVEAYEGIQLFIQRAQRARPGFTLSKENSAHIVRIGQLVKGMPLGLELAAAWTRMMSCQEIAHEIEQELDFLTTSLRDVPERHQSLRAVFEQSWQLLSGEERAVFRKLSVFRGGFHRRAAERVAGASLLLLSTLVDKSLLHRTRGGRYEIHELLRQYAAERLNKVPNEMEETQDRHADYYLIFLQQRTDDLKGRQQKRAREVITEEIDNVRTGWSWAITQRNTAALGRAADSLMLFYDLRSWFPEGEAAFRQAVEMLTIEQHAGHDGYIILMAQLLRGQGYFSAVLGFVERGQKLLQQSVSLLREAGRGSQPQLAFSLYWLAAAPYIFQGHYSEAKRLAQESLDIFRAVGDLWGIGGTLWILGVAAQYQGDYAEANKVFEESARVLRQLGSKGHKMLAFAVLSVGSLARIRGEYGPAEPFLEEALQMSRDIDNPQVNGYILRDLGYLAIALGNYYPQAKERMERSLRLFQEIGARSASVFPLDGLGSVARLRGEYQQAEQLHRESLAICQEIDESRGIALCLHNLGRLAYDREDYPTAKQYLQESLTRFKEMGHQHGEASSLCHLGYVACEMENAGRQETSRYFKQALQIAAKIGANPVILEILVGLATLLVADESEDTGQVQAVELIAFVLHHSASEQETKDRARRLLDQLVSSLPPESVAAAQERGKAGKLDTVLKEVPETTA